MFKPSATKPIPKGIVNVAASTYHELCRTAIVVQENRKYKDYLSSVIRNKASLHRHIRAFEIYAPYLNPGDQILDWGCRHAPDACMIKVYLDDAELHGCDIPDTATGNFEHFFSFADLKYSELNHVSDLPYDSSKFDVVLSSGVLEHVAIEHQSISEVWRILKPDGLFIVTFLPNYYSATERMSRILKTYAGHNRLYKLAQIKDRLLRSGFVIVNTGYHQFFPTFAKGVDNMLLARIGDMLYPLNRVFERIYPFFAFSANLYLIVKKVEAM